MQRQFLWLALLVLSATFAGSISCGKQNIGPILPPETQTGAGTFACLINGEVWTYKDHNEWLSSKPTTYWEYNPNYNSGTLDIGGLKYDDKNGFVDRLDLSADSLQFKKERLLMTQPFNKNIYVCYSAERCNDECASPLIPKSFRGGTITITKLDTSKGIIAGRFEYKIYKFGCTDTLRITDGRFDLKIK